jgi:hypothetical protein
MKKLLKVHYTVQYVKEIELELDGEIEEHFIFNNNLDNLHDSKFYKLQELNEDILTELPIPTLYKDNRIIEIVEYVDDSFEINYFKE